MLSKCANPGCSASFRYFHQGQLFRWDTSGNGNGHPPEAEVFAKSSSRRLEFFWLCAECAPLMTLVCQKGTGVVTQPILRTKAAAAATSGASPRSAG